VSTSTDPDHSTARPDDQRRSDPTGRAGAVGLHRVLLGARDLDRSADFYGGVLGFTEVPTAEPGPRPARCFASGDVLVQLTAAGPDATTGAWVNEDRQGGIRHLGMRVGDVDAQVRRLAAAGVTVLSPPADVLGDVRIAFFLDPDGARLEFIQGNLAYQHVHSPDLAATQAATRLAPADGPRFDHVAVTVADLPAALRFWVDALGFEVVGEIRHHDDPRGFLMTYLRAGSAVLEVFSFDVPTAPNPPPDDPTALLGFRGVGVRADGARATIERALRAGGRVAVPPSGAGPGVVLDPDGVPVLVEGAGSGREDGAR
jgi:catechol 2,3-dioxygenase-like lactoylglutathione lyase family enzyme